jgi:hypothetical protein
MMLEINGYTANTFVVCHLPRPSKHYENPIRFIKQAWLASGEQCANGLYYSMPNHERRHGRQFQQQVDNPWGILVTLYVPLATANTTGVVVAAVEKSCLFLWKEIGAIAHLMMKFDIVLTGIVGKDVQPSIQKTSHTFLLQYRQYDIHHLVSIHHEHA